MKILSIDTSSASGSIAVLEDGSLVSEWTTGSAGAHASWLLKSISAHLQSLDLDISAIDYFAIDIGPGSFTGLRIGIATIKGLAWPLGKKVIGVSTLAALVMNLPLSASIVCPVLDARKNEVYSALYGTSGPEPVPVMQDSVLKPEALFQEISSRGLDNVVFLGSGASAYKEDIIKNVSNAVMAPEALSTIRASNIGLLAFRRIESAVPASVLTPVYLRKSEAEIKFG